MNAEAPPDRTISRIASAIGEVARVRILYSLLDGRARTSTELAAVAEVSPSTASVHLQRLKTERLVKVLTQGKHRYYSLQGPNVARALEALNVIAAGSRHTFVPATPSRLLSARTCYDHIAGSLGVSLRSRFTSLGWLSARREGRDYGVSVEGVKGFASLGIDLDGVRRMRRRFAYACLDWSERQPHVGGALGAALLETAIRRKWVVQDLDSRALHVTGYGRRELLARLGLRV